MCIQCIYSEYMANALVYMCSPCAMGAAARTLEVHFDAAFSDRLQRLSKGEGRIAGEGSPQGWRWQPMHCRGRRLVREVLNRHTAARSGVDTGGLGGGRRLHQLLAAPTDRGCSVSNCSR